jgi:hypothetical protein
MEVFVKHLRLFLALAALVVVLAVPRAVYACPS